MIRPRTLTQEVRKMLPVEAKAILESTGSIVVERYALALLCAQLEELIDILVTHPQSRVAVQCRGYALHALYFADSLLEEEWPRHTISTD